MISLAWFGQIYPSKKIVATLEDTVKKRTLFIRPSSTVWSQNEAARKIRPYISRILYLYLSFGHTDTMLTAQSKFLGQKITTARGRREPQMSRTLEYYLNATTYAHAKRDTFSSERRCIWTGYARVYGFEERSHVFNPRECCTLQRNRPANRNFNVTAPKKMAV
jgi:hypothetical protein